MNSVEGIEALEKLSISEASEPQTNLDQKPDESPDISIDVFSIPLPSELQQLIFEFLVRLDGPNRPYLRLVSKMVNEVVLSVLYESIHFLAKDRGLLEHMQQNDGIRFRFIRRAQIVHRHDPLSVQTVSAFPDITPIRLLKKMPHLIHLALWEDLDTERNPDKALEICTVLTSELHHIRRLSLGDYRDFQALLSYVRHAQSEQKILPLMRTVTHLDVSTVIPSLEELSLFTALTHLCVTPTSPEQTLEQACETVSELMRSESFIRLKMIVVLEDPNWGYTRESIGKQLEMIRVRDTRVIVMDSRDPEEDWSAYETAGRDVWNDAEDVVNARNVLF
ncbi:hypothetical protein DL96DRAFT_1684984 [Flagelloscypha sp. PMI_526]|nr:hypothetical protein DL96DRAFT_1684984 [Flagelloscypha sp. PMI_526]